MKTEKEFLEHIRNEIATAGYGEGVSFNLPFIATEIAERIEELENVEAPLREGVKIDFSEIFAHATKEFGIEWNPCNDLFFDTALDYKSYNEYDRHNIMECIETDHEEPEQITKCEIDAMENSSKAHAIILHYMLANNIFDVLIKND